jgi:hypothetical protein
MNRISRRYSWRRITERGAFRPGLPPGRAISIETIHTPKIGHTMLLSSPIAWPVCSGEGIIDKLERIRENATCSNKLRRTRNFHRNMHLSLADLRPAVCV